VTQPRYRVNPSTPDHVPDDFAREFEAMFNDETVLPFATTAWRAWCLMTAVQLASRHPAAMKAVPIQVAVDMARQIQSLIATTPGSGARCPAGLGSNAGLLMPTPTNAEPTRVRLRISLSAFTEIRRKIAQTNGGLIDDRVPEIELDGVTIEPERLD
jgi:hypothetical protein